jgi:hypothetical protein
MRGDGQRQTGDLISLLSSFRKESRLTNRGLKNLLRNIKSMNIVFD